MVPLLAPAILGCLAAVGAWHWVWYPAFPDLATAMSFGGTIASISSTMLGFLLAALAVLASISHTPLVKQMQAFGHYRDLLRTLLVDGLFFVCCAVCGFVLLFGIRPSSLFLSILLGLHVAAFLSLFDVGRKLWFVLINLRAP